MIYELVLRNFNCSLEFVFSLLLLQPFNFSPVSFACNFYGLRMGNFTWNRFPIKNLLIDSLLTPIVESTYLKRPENVHFGLPVSSEISDLCEISDLLLFLSYFTSQNKEIKFGNYFFYIYCVNSNILVRCQAPTTNYSARIISPIEIFWT